MHANISPGPKKKNFFSGTFETCPNPAKRVPGHASQIWNVLEKNVLGNVYSLARTFFWGEKKFFFFLCFFRKKRLVRATTFCELRGDGNDFENVWVLLLQTHLLLQHRVRLGSDFDEFWPQAEIFFLCFFRCVDARRRSTLCCLTQRRFVAWRRGAKLDALHALHRWQARLSGAMELKEGLKFDLKCCVSMLDESASLLSQLSHGDQTSQRTMRRTSSRND
jgi:hypothetical protein